MAWLKIDMQSRFCGLVFGLVPLVVVFGYYWIFDPTWHADASQSDGQMEGLKALADWGKWVISLEIALVSGLGFALVKNEFQLKQGSVALLVAAAVSFTISILAAAMLLGQIPPALERVPIAAPSGIGCDMYSFKSHLPLLSSIGVQIRHLAGTVGTYFAAGLLFSIAGLLWPKAT